MLERANWWRNTFNALATPAEGYQQARNKDGSWVGGFSPSTDVGFAQGSSATYTWMVPQNVAGLAEAMGGTAVAARRLDGFFHDTAGNWAVKGGSALRYDPANEPGLHTPWLYNGLGQPWKTQATTREIVDTVYTTGPGGLPGNDDLGTMSAWYVFAAMGVFPQVPGRAELLVGSPLFPTVHVARDNGVGIVIDAPATTDAAQYVQSATLDGVAYGKSWLPESFVRTGGTLNLTMGTAASTWGSPPPDQVGVASFCGPVSRPQGTAVSTWPFDGTAGGATLVGAPQWTAGHAGQALLLNGSGQYADTGRAVLPTTGNYTVAAWVRLDAAGAFRTVVSQDGATSSAFFLQYSGADKTFAMSFADRRALAPLTPVTGRWYHLAGVRDADAGHLSLYVDGVLARQIDACTADAATGPLVTGRARWGGAPVDYWAGAIDDVRAYDRALTAAQVKALV
ncbi:hypothetical protein GCM10009827_003920 [Dactylosporangium maewongense]|uniref:LamG-like jellyroll fold domain-containing protein n=1 Tax=Dactylosporangium maewongense TaxID=634393 RepID=A0ABN1ZIZ7_9ACTN